MKRYMMTMFLACAACISAFAMGYEEARREALYLTDKMAYELNLNADQYDYAYEINLDYLLSLNSRHDINGLCYRHRCADLRDILYDWQYNLFLAADYFLRPVVWRSTGWYFPIYSHYARGHFFYSRPRVYYHYSGGHARSHYHKGFYVGRRPHWDRGFRGSHTGRVHHVKPSGGRTIRGNGYSFSLPDKGKGRPSSMHNGGRVNDNQVSGRPSSAHRNGSVSRSSRDSETRRSSGAVRSGRPTFRNSSTRTTVNRQRSASAPSQNHSVVRANRSERKSSVSSGRGSSSGRGTRGERGGR